MPPRLTKLKFIANANKVHGNKKYSYTRFIYVNNRTKSFITCNDCEEDFEQTANNHVDLGQGCPGCANKKKKEPKVSYTEFVKSANFIHQNGYTYPPEEKFVNMNTKIEITHKKCRRSFWQKPSMHKHGNGCSPCFRTVLKTRDEFIEEANAIHGEGEYDYSKVVYLGKDTPVIIIHNECKIENEQTPRGHINGNRCFNCYGFVMKSKEEFVEEATEIYGDCYDYSKVEYKGTHIPVILIHKKCKTEFSKQPANFLMWSGCPKCKLYKGEARACKALDNDDVKYVVQKTFDDCVHKRVLPFDIYIPDKNVVIEIDGEQHFRSIEHYGGEEGFRIRKLRDKIKSDYCKEKGIKMFRILCKDNVEEKIEQIIEYLYYKEINDEDGEINEYEVCEVIERIENVYPGGYEIIDVNCVYKGDEKFEKRRIVYRFPTKKN